MILAACFVASGWLLVSAVRDMRDADGQEAWTWHDGDEWTRTAWRETEDRQEYQSEEWWTPVEYRADA